MVSTWIDKHHAGAAAMTVRAPAAPQRAPMASTTRRRTLFSAVGALCFLVAGAATATDLETQMENIRRGDFRRAIEDITPIAQRGEARAQYLLGTIYLHGYVDSPKPGEAAHWITRAAEQDFVPAQTELARMYRNGDGVESDIAKTAYWYLRAAELGDVGAQLFVADAYAYGLGLKVNRVQAYKWYEIAMRYWGYLALTARDEVAKEMRPEEIAVAEKLAADWLKAKPN